MKVLLLPTVTLFATFFNALLGASGLNFTCSNFQISKCTFFAATLVTDEYISHAVMLQKRIKQLTSDLCQLEIVYAGNKTELYKNRLHTSKSEIQYDNKFAGIDVKNVAIQGILDCMPEHSVLLWIDATILVMNFESKNVLNIIGSNHILFAREGRKSINIGVMIIRNQRASRIFFERVTKYIQRGYWDQGVVSCMLSSKTRHNCSRIKISPTIRWSFLPAPFAEVFRVRNSGICPESRFFSQEAPSFIKLIGPNQAKRVMCMQRVCKEQNV